MSGIDGRLISLDYTRDFRQAAVYGYLPVDRSILALKYVCARARHHYRAIALSGREARRRIYAEKRCLRSRREYRARARARFH